jgi:hypothetical protein
MGGSISPLASVGIGSITLSFAKEQARGVFVQHIAEIKNGV